MPKVEYRKLKNRKSARELRKKKKGHLCNMQSEIEELRQKNQDLQEKVKTLERKLDQAQLIERMRSKGIHVPSTFEPKSIMPTCSILLEENLIFKQNMIFLDNLKQMKTQ